MAEDRPLEPAQLLAGLEAEVLVEHAPPGAVHVKGRCLSLGPVEGDHQLSTKMFAERVLADESLELGNELRLTPEREIGVDALLEGGEPLLVEPDTRGARKRRVELGEGRAAPQRKRLAQQFGRLG